MSRVVNEDQPAITGIDANLVRHELIRLRDKRFATRDDFEAVSGLYSQLVNQVEKGSVPRLDAMARWTQACGMSLSNFFAHCEALQSGRAKDFIVEHPLIADARSLVAKDRTTADAFHQIFRKLLSRLGSPRK